MTSRRKFKVAAAVATIVAAGLLSSGPASADCVYAELYYRQPGGNNQYVYGPKKCVAQTPLPPGIDATLPPTGEPSLIVVGGRVWLPVP